MNKRIEWIDTAKGIGIICVILGHLQAPGLFPFIYSFHIPLFFFLSGYLFNDKIGFKELLKRKSKSLLLPYVVLGLPLVALSLLVEEKEVSLKVVSDYLVKFVLQQRMYVIWFLTCLFVLEILCFFINMFISKKTIQLIIELLLCIGILLFYKKGGNSFIWNIDISIMAMPFYTLGMIFKEKQLLKVLSKKRIITILIFVFWIIGTIINGRIFGTVLDMYNNVYGNIIITYSVSVLGIVSICYLCNYFSNRFIVFIGRNSLIFFAWHVSICFRIIDYVCNKLGFFTETVQSMGLLEKVERVLVYFIFSIIILTIIVLVFNQFKKLLLSKKEK